MRSYPACGFDRCILERHDVGRAHLGGQFAAGDQDGAGYDQGIVRVMTAGCR